jgi:hypothetical protein
MRREKFDLNSILLKGKESWFGILVDIEETFVLDLDDVDGKEVSAIDLEITGRDQAGAKHLVNLLDKLIKL